MNSAYRECTDSYCGASSTITRASNLSRTRRQLVLVLANTWEMVLNRTHRKGRRLERHSDKQDIFPKAADKTATYRSRRTRVAECPTSPKKVTLVPKERPLKISLMASLSSLFAPEKFPVLDIRESDRKYRRFGLILIKNCRPEANCVNFPVYFPVSREFRAETGSYRTASSASQPASQPASVRRFHLVEEPAQIRQVGSGRPRWRDPAAEELEAIALDYAPGAPEGCAIAPAGPAVRARRRHPNLVELHHQ